MWNDTSQLPKAATNELKWPLTNQLIVALSDYRLMVIEGPDAEKFLQGQCTCDFRRLAQQEWVRGAHCNAKGRMHSSFVAAQLGENRIGLRMHASVLEAAMAAMAKYILFSKAEATVCEALLLGIAAPQELDLNGVAGPLPHTGKFISQNSQSLLRLSETAAELWLTAETDASVIAQLRGNWGAMACWHEYMLRQGIAEVTQRSYEQLLPQELNYQLIDGVSFDKGCYTGQEIVARMHYRGKLKKHLYLAETELQPGELCNYGDEVDVAGKPVGKVIDQVIHNDGKCILLALVNDDAIGQTATLRHSSQPILQWQTLPYAIPNEKV